MKRNIEKPFKGIFSVDLRSIALMRIGVALLILTTLYIRSRDLTAFYTDAGLFPRSESIRGFGNIPASLHLISGSFEFQVFMFLLSALFAILLLLGYKTRLATIISYILFTSLINRNAFVANAGDAILDVILLWGIFLPWHARFSVDSVRNAKYRILDNNFFSVGTIGYVVQVFCIYFFASLLKDNLDWRVYGTAVQISLQSRHVTTIGNSLLQLPAGVLRALNFSVLLYEFLGSLFLFYPRHNGAVRTLVIFGFIAMHIGFALCLNLGNFSQIAIVVLTGLLPSFFWATLNKLIKKVSQQHLTIYFDQMCGSCEATVHTIKTFLLIPSLSLTPSQEIPSMEKEMNETSSWIIVDDSNKHYLKYNGVHLVIKNSLLLFWLTPLSLLVKKSGFGDRIYSFLASKRKCKIKQQTKPNNPSVIFEKSMFCSYAAMLLLLCIVFFNIISLFRIQKMPLPRLSSFIGSLQLSQSWVMFSHVKLHPTKKWIVIPGRLQNGKVVDLFQNGKPLSWKTPIVTSETFKNSSWITLMNELATRRGGYNFKQYGKFLCSEWNSHHSNSEKLQTLDIYLASQQYSSHLKEAQYRTLLLSNYSCAQ